MGITFGGSSGRLLGGLLLMMVLGLFAFRVTAKHEAARMEQMMPERAVEAPMPEAVETVPER